MPEYQVQIIFSDGTNTFTFPQVQSETGSDLEEDKSVIIEGNRASGCLYIPGGKKSLRLTIKGILMGDDYKDLTTQMTEMKSKVTTNLATLTLKHYDGGWQNDYVYTVRRIGKITFDENLRTDYQPYSVDFIIINY